MKACILYMFLSRFLWQSWPIIPEMSISGTTTTKKGRNWSSFLALTNKGREQQGSWSHPTKSEKKTATTTQSPLQNTHFKKKKVFETHVRGSKGANQTEMREMFRNGGTKIRGYMSKSFEAFSPFFLIRQGLSQLLCVRQPGHFSRGKARKKKYTIKKRFWNYTTKVLAIRLLNIQQKTKWKSPFGLHGLYVGFLR